MNIQYQHQSKEYMIQQQVLECVPVEGIQDIRLKILFSLCDVVTNVVRGVVCDVVCGVVNYLSAVFRVW